jgi:hypothetical protein
MNSMSEILYKIRYLFSLRCLNTSQKLTCFFNVFTCQNKCSNLILFEYHLDYSKHWLINFYFTCVHNVSVNGLFFIGALRWKHGKIDPKVKHNKFARLNIYFVCNCWNYESIACSCYHNLCLVEYLMIFHFFFFFYFIIMYMHIIPLSYSKCFLNTYIICCILDLLAFKIYISCFFNTILVSLLKTLN